MPRLPGVIAGYIALGLLAVPARAEAPLQSGPQAGETITAIFEPLNVTGPFAGEPHCMVCENGVSPVAMIFAREISPPLVRLMVELDKATGRHRAQEMGSFVVFLSDEDKLAEQLKKIARQHDLKHIVLTIDPPSGPEGFNVAKDAAVTVVLYREFQVQANHTFKKGELTDEAAKKILADVPKIVPSK